MTASRSRAGASRMEGVSLHLYGKQEESRGAAADGPGPVAPWSAAERSPRGNRGTVTKDPPLEPSLPCELQPQARSIFVIAERLVQIWCSNERELAELRTLRQKEQRVRAYLSSPQSNPALGHACLERLEKAYENHLARLCENRRELSGLLPQLDAEGQSEMAIHCLRSRSQTAERRRLLLDSRPTHCWYA
jgi:hypothetical protein